MRDLTRQQLLIIAAMGIALATLVAGVYGLVRGPSGDTTPHGARPTPDAAAVTPSAQSTASTVDRSLPQTTDPITYARTVAESLFDWDTGSGYLPADYTATVLADADPSGEETPGLLDDVATYLPTTEQWLDLGSMNVSQFITIVRAYVPDSWTTAMAQAHGDLRPGTTAVTIAGNRNRHGVWNSTPATSSSPVSFTVFVACPPAFDRCHILRLSQLDKPLR